MQTMGQIRQTLEDSQSMKMVAQAYTEIAAMKLQKIRSGIEKNRSFFQEVLAVYRVVKVAALKANIAEASKTKDTLSILLTSNKRFYGDLENRLIEFFIENTSKFPTDRVIVGTTAKEYLGSTNFSLPYQVFIPKDDLPLMEEMVQIARILTDYQQILVYYPRMQSVLVQHPHVVDLLQHPPESFLESSGHTFNYIFEPEIQMMMSFFNGQVTLLLLEQTFLESELARTAARLISMDKAQVNAGEIIQDQKRFLARAKRSIDNTKLLDTFAGSLIWRKEQNG